MNRWLAVVTAGAVLAAAACGSSSKSSTNSSSTSTSPTAAYPAASSTTIASHTTTTLKTNGSARPVVLKVAANAKLKQQIIVDAAGKTVYAYVPDGASTTSKVPKALASVWPALTSTAKNPMVGAGLAAGKLHVEMQPDGKQQVAYNGHLLYLFSGDRSRGVANGQGLGNIWYVLSPTGTVIK